MTFILTNTLRGNLTLDGVTIPSRGSKTVEFVGAETLAAAQAGTITTIPALTGLSVGADFSVDSLTTLTDSSTGTAATITSGAAEIAAVTDVATAADAIATLTAVVEAQRAILINLVNTLEVERALNAHQR